MYLFNNYKFSKIVLLNFLIAAIPLSLILGNLATNINIVLICIIGLLSFGKKIFFIEKKINYLIYFFFLYLIFITLFNNFQFIEQNDLYFEHLLKSIFFLRFLILFLVINKLIDENIFNTNIFFISCAFFSLIISIDIVIQFIFKKNILGYSVSHFKAASFFNEEKIAGSFLQKFSLFLIFLIVLKKKSIKKLNILVFILFIIMFIPIVLSGNRMPALVFGASIPFYFLIEKKIKQVFLSTLIVLSILTLIIKVPVFGRLSKDIKIFVKESKTIIREVPELFLSKNPKKNYAWHTGYLAHFNTGVYLWKQNKVFGQGLKSFRLNSFYSEEHYLTHNTHPHNYFIEILVDTGLVGLIMIYSIFFVGMFNYIKYYLNKLNKESKLTTCVFFMLTFFEFFPLKSTGSFFTTGNATFIFLILPMFLNFKKIKSL